MQLHEMSKQTHDRLVGAGLDPRYVADIIRHTIAEDLDGGIDVTSVATVPIAQRSIATFGARAQGCVAGLDIAAAVIEMVCGASASSFEYKKQDGQRVVPGDVLAQVEASTQFMLTAERTALNAAPFDEEAYKKDLDIDALYGEKGYSTIERTGVRPTLDCNGIWGGYIGEGSKTVLPSKAFAKISMRLVPHQTTDQITEMFSNHFKSIAPAGVRVEVRPHHGGEPVVTPTDSKAYIAASDAMEKTFGKKPIPTRGGGSIPIVAMFESELNLKSVLMGFGLDTDALHSPNEHYGLVNYYKGIETIPYFFDNFSK